MLNDISLYPGLAKALEDGGFTRATPVQQQVIPLALNGSDIMVCARTGTGKTLAYLVPMIERLCQEKAPQGAGTLGLILLPTRELARQVFKQCEALCQSTPVNVQLLLGGESFRIQIADLRKNPEIVVATPGRLLELLDRKALDLAALKMLVLDEADRVLEMGFGEDVSRVAAACNGERQTMMLSATLGRAGLDGLRMALLRNPLLADLSDSDAPAISHRLMLADDRSHKNDELVWLLKHLTYERALVFANTRENSERLFTLVRAQGHECGVLHGDKDQQARSNTMNRFRHGRMRILVASDVAARGIDIPDVDLVINFDMPRRGDDYTHRVGRTGRAGRSGIAVSLVEPGEWNLMISVQRYLKLTFERFEVDELRGKFKGPKQTKGSGKSAGKKKKKSAVTGKGTGKRTARKKTATASKSKRPTLSGNETLRRRKPDPS